MAALSCGISCDRSMMRGVLLLRVDVGNCSSSKAVLEAAVFEIILCISKLMICKVQRRRRDSEKQ